MSSKADVKQAVSPIAKADRRGSAAAAEVSSSSEDEGADAKKAAPAAGRAKHAKHAPAGKSLWRQILLVKPPRHWYKLQQACCTQIVQAYVSEDITTLCVTANLLFQHL